MWDKSNTPPHVQTHWVASGPMFAPRLGLPLFRSFTNVVKILCLCLFLGLITNVANVPEESVNNWWVASSTMLKWSTCFHLKWLATLEVVEPTYVQDITHLI